MLFKDTKNIILLSRINYNPNSRQIALFGYIDLLLQKYLPEHWVTVSIRKVIFQSSSLGTQNPGLWGSAFSLCMQSSFSGVPGDFFSLSSLRQAVPSD